MRGQLVLAGNSTYRGNTTINDGTLKITGSIYDDGAYNGAAVVTVNSGATLELNSWGYGTGQSLGYLTYNTGNLVIDGGTVRMMQNSTATRGFTIGATGATLEAPGGVTWTVSDNVAKPWEGIGSSAGGTLTLTGAGSGQIDKPIPGSGNVVKTGSGTWTLTGDNTYTGPTTISDGTLTFSTPSFNTYRGGTITIEGDATMNVVTTGGFNRYDFQHKTIEWDSTGGGTLSLGPAINFVLDTASSGTTTFRTNGGAQNSIVGPGGVNMGNAGHTVDFDVAPGTGASGLLVSTGLTNGAGIRKTGDGTLTLTAVNSYTGGTTVDDGTLELSRPGNSGSGTIRGTLTVNPGATVKTTTTNSLGWGGGTRVTTLNLNGGLLDNTATGDQGWGIEINMTGGTLQSNGGVSSSAAGSYFSLGGGSSINSLASPTTSVIAGRINLRRAIRGTS